MRLRSLLAAAVVAAPLTLTAQKKQAAELTPPAALQLPGALPHGHLARAYGAPGWLAAARVESCTR